LAELGAFASNETIRKTLRIIIQEKYANSESFIRFGPVERIRTDGSDYVGFYPWIANADQLDETSADPHLEEIVIFINTNLSKFPEKERFPDDKKSSLFYVIYWLIYILLAAPFQTIIEHLSAFNLGLTQQELRQKLYCMTLAGWIGKTRYSNKEYYYVLFDIDPFDYAFRDKAQSRDTPRRKFLLAEELTRTGLLPEHVRTAALRARRQK
jgi:hypothetical protein